MLNKVQFTCYKKKKKKNQRKRWSKYAIIVSCNKMLKY